MMQIWADYLDGLRAGWTDAFGIGIYRPGVRGIEITDLTSRTCNSGPLSGRCSMQKLTSQT